jgi:hypothetical protein
VIPFTSTPKQIRLQALTVSEAAWFAAYFQIASSLVGVIKANYQRGIPIRLSTASGASDDRILTHR